MSRPPLLLVIVGLVVATVAAMSTVPAVSEHMHRYKRNTNQNPDPVFD